MPGHALFDGAHLAAMLIGASSAVSWPTWGFRHAVTLVDSLDTLWLLGLRAEFNESVVWCKENLPARFKTLSRGTSAFETIIRTLGGLEGAHALSQDPELLKLATQLGDRLIEIVQPDGSTPYAVGGGSGGMGCPSLAESGTCGGLRHHLCPASHRPLSPTLPNHPRAPVHGRVGRVARWSTLIAALWAVPNSGLQEPT